MDDFLRFRIVRRLNADLLRWKYLRNLELSKVSSLGFGNISNMMEISVDVTVQATSE